MTTAEVEALGDQHLAAAEQRLKMISQDRALRIQYEQRRKAEMDAAAGLRDQFLQGKKLGVDEGKKLGVDEGKKLGLRVACLALCEVLGIKVSEERRAWLEQLGLEQLEGLQKQLTQQRTWPAE